MEEELLYIWKSVAGITTIQWHGKLVREIQSTPEETYLCNEELIFAVLVYLEAAKSK